MRRTPVAIAVFARAPAPGRSKSRLVARLGAWGAARLHARLVERTLRTALAARCGPVELHCAPHARHAFFRRCAARFGVSLHAQGEGDLGVRMARVFARGLRRHRALLLIGSDIPALRASDLRRAARALALGGDAVIAPAEDGGYALIGLRRAAPRIFEAIAWGGPQVYAQTRRRLATLDGRWRELRTVWDVDRIEDCERLRASGLMFRGRRFS